MALSSTATSAVSKLKYEFFSMSHLFNFWVWPVRNQERYKVIPNLGAEHIFLMLRKRFFLSFLHWYLFREFSVSKARTENFESYRFIRHMSLTCERKDSENILCNTMSNYL